MLDKISKILLLIGILSLIGCSIIDKKTCINHFNNRVSILTKDSQIIKSINLINKNIFCGDQTYSEFYNNINLFLLGLNNNQKKNFYVILFFTEFHKNDNGGEFIEFLLRNKIDISDQYIEISTNNHLISQMKYTNEELLNIKKLGELLKK
ncbi:TPA: hypothetical protein PVK60_001639 [Acinetobacter baumannii]|jgi:hypothetical protein|uniref:Lipoprotein n=1 Tax=Acinetobacter baumannii EGD-HP18 TaxID=1358412 RepID=A0AAV3K127_ACIBA|nr:MULTISPECIES: hypothetical protein [Acinetobacter]ERH70151.1 hypothetical protein N173_15395 [Acinetobacter baumannii EGD-HP18]MBJ9388054.1 hypothetical protein [Acinetobacter baumannii]MBJ9431929.1 hypothetical protein [Acinetobacter baumannii]MCE6409214.1 hypothetical protein [Acinetobacter baumannii]MCT9371989.1 hypothetical protein [Acinetobacter baumannii]